MRHEPGPEPDGAQGEEPADDRTGQAPDEIMLLVERVQRVVVRLLGLEPRMPFDLLALKSFEDGFLRFRRVGAETIG